jgi:hypothetical protein
MKTLSILTFILFSMNISAQTNSYNGKAKTFVDKCLKYIDEIKKIETLNPSDKVRLCRVQAENAKRQIEYIKQKDPSYYAASLEAIITPYLEAASVAVNERNDKIRAAGKNANKDGDGIAGLFMGTTTTEIRTTGNIESDIANHKQQLISYNQKVDNLITTGVAGASQYENHIRQQSVISTKQIKKAEEQINKADSKLGLIAYRELVGIETYWAAAKKVFPSLGETDQVHKMAVIALNKMGSEEQVTMKIKKNYEDKIKNKKMPAALIVNSGLETEFKKVFSNSFKDLTILKINIIARDWTIIRNEISGAILGRKHSAAIAVKTKEGNCALYYFHIGQQYTGNGYGVSAENARSFDGEIACENVK